VITKWDQGNESIIFEREKLKLPLKLLNVADYQLLVKQISANIIANKIDPSVPQMKKLFDLFSLNFPSDIYIKDVLNRVNMNWMNKHNLPDCMETLEEVLLKEIFYSIYEITDIDEKGDIDIDEFILVLEQLGRKNFNKDLLQDMINRYDADFGLLNVSEFSLVMIYEICLVKPEKTNLVNKKTSKSLVIPTSGKCTIVMESICEESSLRQVASTGGFDCVLKNIHHSYRSDEKEIIFDHITLSPYFQLDCKQATHLFTLMCHGGELSHIDRIIAIIPNIVNIEHRLMFCDSVLDPNGRLKLRDSMGQCYNAFFGCPSGHFLLDLKNKNHLECSKLLAIESIGNMNYCEKVGTNCGQRGNYSQFRNEELLSCPTWKAGPFVILTGKWFESKPKDGQLRFDYFSMKRLKIGTFPISNKRFQGLLEYLDLDEIEKIFKENVDRKELLSIPPISVVRMKESWFEYMSSSHKYHDVFPPERIRFKIAAHDENAEENKDKDDDETVESTEVDEKKSSKNVAKVLSAADLYVNPCFPLLYKKLFQLQVAISKIPGLSVAQICEILEKFPQIEGTCFIRVQILQSCWDRIVDVQNIYIIYDKFFNEDDQKVLYIYLSIYIIIYILYVFINLCII
jgi:Ca2+-binding EF-hand superfamily protein